MAHHVIRVSLARMRRVALLALMLVACRADRPAPIAIAHERLLSSEIALDGATLGAADGTQTARDLSFDGSRWYAIWLDARTGATELRGSRVDASGAPLDGRGTVLATTATTLGARVAFDGTSHVVVYADSTGVWARPVGTDGVPGTAVSVGTGSSPAIASNGDGALITWASGADIVVRPRSKTGTLGGATTLGLGNSPRLAWDGTTYALEWTLGKDLLGKHVDAAGAAVETTATTLYTASGTSFSGGTDVGCRAGTCFVGAREFGQLSLVRWTSAGTVSAGPTRTGFGSGPVSIASDGTVFHVVHTSALATAEDVRLDDTGTVVGTSTFDSQVDALECGTSCLALLSYQSDVAAVRLSGATVLDPVPQVIGIGTNAERRPMLAFDGARYLAVWSDSRNDGGDIYGVRLDATGKVLDAAAFPISTAPRAQTDPAVSFDGSSFVVAWVDARAGGIAQHLYAARVTPSGTVVDPAGVPIISAPDASVGAPSIASRSGESFLAYPLSLAGAPARIVGTRVNAALTKIDATPLAVSTGGDSEDAPVVATNGSTWLAAWARGSVTPHLYTSTVSSTGVIGATNLLSAATGSQRQVSIAARGTTFLAAWLDGTSSNDVRYARLDGAGALLDPAGGLALTTTTVSEQLPWVLDDGTSFFVSWYEGASSSATSTTWHGAFIGTDGSRPAPTSITESLDGSVRALRAASAKDGSRLLVYQRSDKTLFAERAVARLHTGRENGRSCATTGDCLSGFCVDGVCCDSACAGQCAACDAAGSVGRCVAVSGAPHGSRGACSAVGAGTPCEARCNGVDTASCSFAATTVSCGIPTCAGGSETHVSTCDGAGKCGDTPKSCGAYACGATSCNTSCTAKADCAGGHYCKEGACTVIEGLGTTCSVASACSTGNCVDGVCCEQPSCATGAACNTPGSLGICKKLPGVGCAGANECASGVCVDGVCCNRACDGQCEACNVTGSEGTCTPVVGAPHGSRAACDDGGGDPCKVRQCDGSTTSACLGWANGTAKLCKPGSCADATYTPASYCDGAGSCRAAEPTSCVPFACGADGCLAACATAADCADGFQCEGGKCQAGARCVDDGASSRGVDGTVTACAPFRCGGDGKCASTCATSADCAPGNACNTATARCEPTAPPTDTEDAGGCSAGRASVGSWWLGLLAALGLVARRRGIRTT